MTQTSADFLAAAKKALGNPFMSDRELGERLGGFSQPAIGKAKAGNMSDNMAAAVGKLLEDKGVVTAGIVLLTARVEREKDAEVRCVWQELLGKISPLMPMKSADHLDMVTGGIGAPSPEGGKSALCIMSTHQAGRAANDDHYKVQRAA